MVQEFRLEAEEGLCPNCGIEVYQAEALLAGNNRWHKRCFKCCFCNKFLNPSNCNVHQGFLFCKHCYSEVTRHERPQTYPDTTIIKGNSGASSKCCPRCKGTVFEAEKVVEKGLTYHRKCFTCVKCKRPQDDKLQVFVGFDNEVYCKVCYPKIWHTPLPMDPQSTSKIRAGPQDNDCCPRCFGKVFEAEKMMVGHGVYHIPCFSCKICTRPIDHYNCVSHQREIFCKACYHQNFDMRSKSVGPGNTSIIKGGTSRETCPRCQGVVFEAEKIAAREHWFHVTCLSCNKCRHKLDASSFNDGPDGEVYCSGCYSVTFGHRSRAKSMGTLDTAVIQAQGMNGCPRCHGAVFEAEKLKANNSVFHIRCATCRSCNHKLDACSLCCGSDGEIYCEGCYSRKFGGAGYRGAHGNRWLDEKANIHLRPCQNVDTSLVKVPGDPNSCHKCQGKVYDLEKVFSKSAVWHKQCFRCNGCKSTLTSTLVYGYEAPDNEIYCKSCFIKNFGEGTKPLPFSDTGLIRAAGTEIGCPRCHGVVFEAEKVVAGDKVWFHQGCFNCQVCHTKLDSMRCAIGTNGDAYCNSCYKAQLQAERSQANIARPRNILPAMPGDPHGCPRCQGKVYEAEKMTSRDRWYHKHCFACALCNHLLDYSNCMEGPNEEVYCKTCYVREYFTGGRNMFCDARTMPTTLNPRNGCPKCQKQVFDVDKVLSKAGVFHRQCLFCGHCKRQLDAFTLNEAQNDIYCQQCYSEYFGVIGKSTSADGRVNTKTIIANEGDQFRCPRCFGKVFEAEKVATSAGNYHPACAKCRKCNGNLDQSSAYCGGDGEIYCQLCYKEEFGVLSRRGRSRSRAGSRSRHTSGYYDDEEDALARANVDTTSIMAPQGDRSACPKCQGKVFEAEKMVSNKGLFHKKCFACDTCKRALDSQLACDGPNYGELYCKNCYQKRYGPTVRIFNESDAQKSLNLSKTKPIDPRKACHRCGGGVFANEELPCNGIVFHKSCASCRACDRHLDLTTVFGGPDKDIYCQGCYARNFGCASYRGVQSNAWVDQNANSNMRYTTLNTTNATNIIKSDTPADACIRCSGKVFQAEKMIVSHGLFHKTCFSCADCHVSLDSTKANDGPNREIYCQHCYSRRYGLHGYGYGGFGSIPALTAGGNETKLDYHFKEFF